MLLINRQKFQYLVNSEQLNDQDLHASNYVD